MHIYGHILECVTQWVVNLHTDAKSNGRSRRRPSYFLHFCMTYFHFPSHFLHTFVRFACFFATIFFGKYVRLKFTTLLFFVQICMSIRPWLCNLASSKLTNATQMHWYKKRQIRQAASMLIFLKYWYLFFGFAWFFWHMFCMLLHVKKCFFFSLFFSIFLHARFVKNFQTQ